MKHLLFLALAPFASSIIAQPSCFETALKKGQTAYNQGQYAKAREYWQTGKECPQSDIKQLDDLISKTYDTDGDGIVNGMDNCPRRSGPASNKGCPLPRTELPPPPSNISDSNNDYDEDGTPNTQDECPKDYGPKTTSGCPDRDFDNVPDKKDDCPDLPGPINTLGCPDRDGDETPDAKDDCPDAPGPKRFNGCPDRDSDQIPDHKDDCPDAAGPKDFNGCPDMDGDKIPDNKDGCPDKPGSVANKGCPRAAPSGMARIPGGNFIMGDLFGEGGNDETQHSVTVDEFYMAKNETTFVEFDAFCSATGREKPNDDGGGRGKRPVINVDWYDAIEYCNWLSQQENRTPAYNINKSRKDPNNTNPNDLKKWVVTRVPEADGYRLPTEAEWEFAARAVTTSFGEVKGGGKVRFGNGKDIASPSQINFNDAQSQSHSVIINQQRKTVDVGSLKNANAFGLFDMSGNVWEWCADWYDNYPSNGQTNPTGPESGADRVFRGGSWAHQARYCRTASRSHGTPTYQHKSLGFRVALSAK